MIALLILAALALLLVFTGATTPRRNDTEAPTPAQRAQAYERRLDDAVGLDSEAHLARVARGQRVKTAMLERCALNAAVSPHRALVPAGALRVRRRARAARRHAGGVA